MNLQVQYTVADFLGAALVPELSPNVAAGAAGHVHLGLVAVPALGTLPNQLAIIIDNLDFAFVATHLAAIALGIQLSVHDIVVDIVLKGQHGFQVVAQVGHLDITDTAAGGEGLELALEPELIKGADFLADIDVVAVSDVVVTFTQLIPLFAKTSLEGFGELVGGGFQWRPVKGVADILRRPPLSAFVIHLLLYGHYSTISLGYAGLYDCVK